MRRAASVLSLRQRPHQLISGSVIGTVTIIPHSAGEEAGRWDQSGKAAMSQVGARSHTDPGRRRSEAPAFWAIPLWCGVHDSALRDQSCFEIAPERNHQFARQCNNSDASDASLGDAGALDEPLAQSAVRLVADPQPGDLDSKPARAGIARFADALINAHRATVVGARRQAKIAGQFAAIVEVTIEYFTTQWHAADLSNAFQAHQCRSLGTTALGWTFFFLRALQRRGRFDRACLRAFDVFDLAFGQGYSFVLAGQRLFGVGRQWFAGARHQTVEALHEIAPVWIDAADSQGHQDPADAVGVGRFLLHQHGLLAVLAFGVLFCRGRHLNYPADARFAALQRQQHANQKLEIDAVGLAPSRTPFHRNACGIDDTVLDAGRRQPAVQPKPVVPGFVNRYHADRLTEFLQPESGNRDPSQGGVNVAPVNFVTTDGLAELRRIQADQPGRFA